ncbi:hypothetical protein PAT3040_01385 [Paenibacillus agaridevorans]|uniref:Uncharacterized protein n=1 Tax=Paenibacillus agaridevorans TaxID=171404 RepID=A0A2R5ETX4_9BACL|nr:hypothetical protein PAT3040_01385 [Paenibacillus agaridevorans]
MNMNPLLHRRLLALGLGMQHRDAGILASAATRTMLVKNTPGECLDGSRGIGCLALLRRLAPIHVAHPPSIQDINGSYLPNSP